MVDMKQPLVLKLSPAHLFYVIYLSFCLIRIRKQQHIIVIFIETLWTKSQQALLDVWGVCWVLWAVMD